MWLGMVEWDLCLWTILKNLRYVGVMRLLFLIGPLDLIGTWFGEDQKPTS